MKKFTVFVFGSSLLSKDRIAWDVADYIVKNRLTKSFEFILSDNPEEIIKTREKDIFILDVVKGIDEVCIIDDIEKLDEKGINTLHDFGLGFYLKLLREVREINKVTIIGIPYETKDDICRLSKKVVKVLEQIGI